MFYQTGACAGSRGRLASPHPTPTPGDGSRARWPELPQPPSPAGRFGALEAPRAARPGPSQRPGAPPVGSARRSPRGDREGAALTSPGAGCSPAPGSGLRGPRSAPLAPMAAAPAQTTAAFIFLNYIGRKTKAKTAERRARPGRAVSAERGPGASGGGGGGGPPGWSPARREPEAGAGPEAGSPAASGEARAPGWVRAASLLSAAPGPRGRRRPCGPWPRAPLGGCWPERVGSGPAASGSLGGMQVRGAEQACSLARACALVPLQTGAPSLGTAWPWHSVPGSSSRVSGEIRQWCG